MVDLGSEVERRLVGMLWGRLRAGYGEVEELEFGWVMLEGAEDEGDAQRRVGCGWKRGRGPGHALRAG